VASVILAAIFEVSLVERTASVGLREVQYHHHDLRDGRGGSSSGTGLEERELLDRAARDFAVEDHLRELRKFNAAQRERVASEIRSRNLMLGRFSELTAADRGRIAERARLAIRGSKPR
jgi:hypothetical protein